MTPESTFPFLLTAIALLFSIFDVPCLHHWASLVAQLVKNLPAMQETLGLEDSGRDRTPTPVFLGFPLVQTVKNLPTIQETWV